MHHYRGWNMSKNEATERYNTSTNNLLGMAGHYTGRSKKVTTERINDSHHIIKWYFDTNSGEVGNIWIHYTDSATGTSNMITVCEIRKCMGKIKLLNVS